MEKVLEDSGIPQMPSTLRQFGQLLIRIWQLRLQQYACHTPLLLRRVTCIRIALSLRYIQLLALVVLSCTAWLIYARMGEMRPDAQVVRTGL